MLGEGTYDNKPSYPGNYPLPGGGGAVVFLPPFWGRVNHCNQLLLHRPIIFNILFKGPVFSFVFLPPFT